jgi:hypothetical protein
MRGRVRWLAIVALGMVFAACGTVIRPIDPAYWGQPLTREKNDTYSLRYPAGP